MTYRLVVVANENAPLRALAGELGDAVQVQMFDSANDALWELRANPPEVVIAEVDLPGMTGLELAEIIPNFELPTRVVLWSDTPNEQTRKQAAEYGVFKVMGGNLSANELRTTLDAAFHDAREAALNAPEPEPEPEPEPAPPPEPEPEPAPPPEPEPAPPPEPASGQGE